MNLVELVRTRRTVHSYKPQKISDSIVERALELSLWAPNHKLTFPWAYFWVEGDSRQRLADLAVELKATKEPMTETKVLATRANVLNPSHMILLGQRRSNDPRRMHEDFATVACGAQLAMLYLWEQGIASKWSTGGYSGHARTFDILGIRQDEFELHGCLFIGVAAQIPPATERPPLAKFLCWAR
jgi:nitroreductase